jgi:hypothetical protein
VAAATAATMATMAAVMTAAAVTAMVTPSVAVAVMATPTAAAAAAAVVALITAAVAILREGKCVNDNQDSDIQSSDDDLNSNVCDDMHIPLFTRTRTVSVDRDGTTYCSCHTFERVGIPCTHQASVATLCYEGEGKVFLGFNHHNVAVRWWSSYMLYAYKETTPMAMNCKFHRLAMNDIKGPNLRLQISPLLALEDAGDIAPAIVRLKNYPGESIDIAKLR